VPQTHSLSGQTIVRFILPEPLSSPLELESKRIRSAHCGEEHLSAETASDREMFFFARFHAKRGNERAVADALIDVLAPSRGEPGCLSIHAFRSIHDQRLFYIHSRWDDEAAFEVHAGLSHTVRFIERVEPLIDHPLDTNWAEKIG
jgi:quinol monooxygenase YgiN